MIVFVANSKYSLLLQTQLLLLVLYNSSSSSRIVVEYGRYKTILVFPSNGTHPWTCYGVDVLRCRGLFCRRKTSFFLRVLPDNGSSF